MKILTVLGARPQFIKAAVVSRCIKQSGLPIHEEILHTGQHYDFGMSQVFFDEMDIPKPTVNLHIGSASHGVMTGEMLAKIEAEIVTRKPDYVLVYGDTNSTLAGALAASKLNVPVGHIEAGERSYNRLMPEEINRVLTDHVSSLLFCCSNKSKACLEKEGISKNVFVVGDVMFDAFLKYSTQSMWPKELKKMSSFALATLHRAQNTDDISRLKSILEAFAELGEDVVLPLHPRTLKIMQAHAITAKPNVHILEPVSYFEMLGLLKECAYVLTDSGGLQKEAYYAGKKCLTLRDETEWTELVEAGVNRVVGVEKDAILSNAAWARESISCRKDIYGDGKAGLKILGFFEKRLVGSAAF